jgi:hypothetical protein
MSSERHLHACNAGVDVLIMDVTNAVRYWDEWDVTFRIMQEMKKEGNKVPQFAFWRLTDRPSPLSRIFTTDL